MWFIGIYASCEDQVRKNQWKVVKDRSRLWGEKWIIMGDFNDIVSNEEKWGGRTREDWSFKDFKQFIEDNQLIDLGFEGNPWTWRNKWESGEIKQRLDRGLSSTGWQACFESPKCRHIDSLGSDHSMLLLDTIPEKKKRKKRFFFDKRWVQKEEARDIIKKAW